MANISINFIRWKRAKAAAEIKPINSKKWKNNNNNNNDSQIKTDFNEFERPTTKADIYIVRSTFYATELFCPSDNKSNQTHCNNPQIR